MDTARIFHTLLGERPKFHGREDAGTAHHAIADDVLKWIFKNLEPGNVTLETGCGYSTIVFALAGGRHTVISPFPQEHRLLEEWCTSHGVSTGNLEFIAETSQDAVPRVGNEKEPQLDMVLIDGDHAFPAPFIDWYYTADRIKRGGYLLVDDTHLVTGKILKEFLLAENMRWKCRVEIGKTAVFEKIVLGPAAKGIPWVNQPYVNTQMKEQKSKVSALWKRSKK